MSAAKPYIGGQAVIEGVMMRSPRSMIVAVRRPDGSIAVREDVWRSVSSRFSPLRWPLVRGGVVLLESIYNGLIALQFSAEQADPNGEVSAPPRSKGQTLALLAMSVSIAIGLFMVLPHGLALGAGLLVGGGAASVEGFAFHAIDGLFKLSIFVLYIVLVRRSPDVRRVFEYHGAEHKVINTYESGGELSVETAKALPTFHPRCGTSFILTVLSLSIVLFAAVFPLLPKLGDTVLLNHLGALLLKIPLLFPLAGFAYELSRFAGAHPGSTLARVLGAPGGWMQRLTTAEPSEDQLEIALAAMRAAVRLEAPAEVAEVHGRVSTFPSFAALIERLA